MNVRQRVGAYAVALDAGRVLLRRMSARTTSPGRWTLPGGGLEHGEDPEQAVLRELPEETGARGAVQSLLGVHSNVYSVRDGESIHGIRLIYRVALSAAAEGRDAGRDDGVDQISWAPLAEAAAWDLSAHARYAVRRLG